MKVVQVVDSFHNGNGVGNCLQSIADVLDQLEIENVVWTRRTDRQSANRKVYIFRKADEILLEEEDILFYHFCLGMRLNNEIQKLSCKKILVYHNVTPPHFFYNTSLTKFKDCLWGYYDAGKTADYYSKCIVPSEFSKKDLVGMGWEAENVEVIPFITLQKNITSPTEKLIRRYRDGYTNFIFTGRIVPNKKIEDVIRIFGFYKKHMDNRSRLFLVGTIGFQNYYFALLEYIKELQINDVIFTGQISQEDMEAYYAVSDIYLCMSEHEGFCLPLIEAMQREIPVIAYAEAAVPDTMGAAGILVETKDEQIVCGQVRRLIEDDDFREKIIIGQKDRVNIFNLDNYKEQLFQIIRSTNEMDNVSNSFTESKLQIKNEITCKIQKFADKFSEKSLEQNPIWVIYGIGEAGNELIDRLRECEINAELFYCDNKLNGKLYSGQRILSHEECVKKYSDAVYIITVQNAVVAITAKLLEDGISKQRIKFYNREFIS